MIQIRTKQECCGCGACKQRCPKHCITLQEDKEGFLYPQIDTTLCIECGLCEKVCPIINQGTKREPLHVYAAINTNEEIREKSSSGGIFTVLAEKIIEENGVVFGARFDKNWEVKHDYTETKEGLSAFRGSKYLQSRIEDNYLKAETFLKEGRKVLFSGTPCQIAGLKKFLKKEFENLLTVDFICHGVPSPKVWRLYLNETYQNIILHDKRDIISHIKKIENRKSYISDINFRHKINGWKKYSLFLKFNSTSTYNSKNSKEIFEPFKHNLFMKAFLSDMILRPSCYHCPTKQGKSQSDITIADFWGVHTILKDFDDDKGTSLVFINNDRAQNIFPFHQIKYKEVTYNSIFHLATGLKEIIPEHKNRTFFFSSLDNNISIISLIKRTTKITPQEQILRYSKKIIRKLIKIFK